MGPRSRKILTNSGWLMAGSVLRLGVGLVVGVLVARHLGPRDFGILNYALSITAFLSTFVYLGMNGIVVRDIVKRPDEADLLLGSTFALELIGACLSYAVIVGLALWGHGSGVETRVLLIVGAMLLFRPAQTIEIWFQSRTESKYSVISQSAAFLLASVGRALLVLLGASLIAFAFAGIAQSAAAAVLLFAIYAYKGRSVLAWRVSASRMLGLLRQSWVLILSGFLAVVYLKLDQLMLRWMIGPEEVGVYSVAVRFSEVWYFIPTAIAASVFPDLVNMRDKRPEDYRKKLQQGFDMLFAIAFSLAVVMAFASGPVIGLLYGSAYDGAGGILTIHIWAGVFIFMRALLSKWIIAEDKLHLSLYSHGLGAVANVALNLLLIPAHGGHGAAVATLVSYAAASYGFLFLSATTRPIALMMTKSLFLPVRLIRFGKGIWR